MAKEAYSYGNRDLLSVHSMPSLRYAWMRECQKRDLCMTKETYLHGKRDLFTWQKRPIYMAKEAC